MEIAHNTVEFNEILLELDLAIKTIQEMKTQITNGSNHCASDFLESHVRVTEIMNNVALKSLVPLLRIPFPFDEPY